MLRYGLPSAPLISCQCIFKAVILPPLIETRCCCKDGHFVHSLVNSAARRHSQQLSTPDQLPGLVRPPPPAVRSKTEPRSQKRRMRVTDWTLHISYLASTWPNLEVKGVLVNHWFEI